MDSVEEKKKSKIWIILLIAGIIGSIVTTNKTEKEPAKEVVGPIQDTTLSENLPETVKPQKQTEVPKETEVPVLIISPPMLEPPNAEYQSNDILLIFDENVLAKERNE